jgi:hypothetical protein
MSNDKNDKDQIDKTDKDEKKESLFEHAKDLARKALDRARDLVGTDEETPPTPPEQIAPPVGAPGPREGLEPPVPMSFAYAPTSPVIAMPPPQPPREPLGMLDLEEPPETYGVDEVSVLPRDPFTLFAYWEVTPDGAAAARRSLGSDGQLVLRLIFAPTGQTAGTTESQDFPLDWEHGRRYYVAGRPGAYVSAAVGLLAAGRFVPIAHAPRVRIPFAEPGPEGPVEWMEVDPTRTRGVQREPLRIVRRGSAAELDVAPTAGLKGTRGTAATRGAPGTGWSTPSAKPWGGPTSPGGKGER